MKRIFLTLLLLTMAGSQATGISQETSPRIIPITRVVRIPLTTISGEENDSVNSPALAVSRGGEDEAPDGPNSFDVLDDGSFLVTDPLARRLSQFSSGGEFRRSWPLGFAADRVTIAGDRTVMVREANTSATYALDSKGGLRPSSIKEVSSPARITSPQTGEISRGGSNQISVQLNRPGFTLLSLQLIGTGEDESAYVAIESTAGETGDEGISLNKSVRRYSAGGKLLSQTSDLPLDYFVTPVDELRVRKGVVYQLMTTPTEVRMNVWDMN